MHFYTKTQTGVEPRHYVKMVSDPSRKRPSRVSDMKKAGKNGETWFPSVTTILDITQKPALEAWRIDQHLETALEFDFDALRMNEGVDAAIKEIKRLTQDRMDRAPRSGTNFHKIMEAYILDMQSIDHGVKHSPEQWKLASDVFDLIEEKTSSDVLQLEPEINIFSDEGYAGQCDLFIHADELVSPSLGPHRGESWVVDYKTVDSKEKWDKRKKKAYWDSHCAQLVAYDMELTGGLSRLVNIFVCLESGEILWHEWTDQKEITKAWEYFMACKELWYVKNG